MFVSIREHAAQLPPRSHDASGHNQRSVPQVDEPDFAAAVDAPTVAQFGGKVRLSAMGDPGVARRTHDCIVNAAALQGEGHLRDSAPQGRVEGGCPRRVRRALDSHRCSTSVGMSRVAPLLGDEYENEHLVRRAMASSAPARR